MIFSQSGKFSSFLVTFGTFGNAFSKWFLLWLFARATGGAEAVGVYSLLLAVGTPIFVVAQYGLRTIFVSHQSRWPWSNYLTFRFVGTILGTFALLIVGLLSPVMPFYLVVSIIFLKVADSIRDLFSARLQYFNQMGTIGLVSVFSAVLTILASTIAVYAFDSVAAAVMSAAVVSGLLGILAAVIASKFEYRPDVAEGGYLGILRAGFPVTLSHLFATLLVQIPVFVVGTLADPRVVGIFAAAAYLLTVAYLFGSSIQIVLITRFRLLRDSFGVSAVVNRASEIARLGLLIGALGVAVVTVFGSDFLKLVYGPSFAMDFGPLALLGLASLATVIGYVYSVTLTVINRYSDITWSFVVGCLASVMVGVGGSWFSVDILLLGTATAFVGAMSRLFFLSYFTARAAKMVY